MMLIEIMHIIIIIILWNGMQNNNHLLTLPVRLVWIWANVRLVKFWSDKSANIIAAELDFLVTITFISVTVIWEKCLHRGTQSPWHLPHTTLTPCVQCVSVCVRVAGMPSRQMTGKCHWAWEKKRKRALQSIETDVKGSRAFLSLSYRV